MGLGAGVDGRCLCATVQAWRPRHGRTRPGVQLQVLPRSRAAPAAEQVDDLHHTVRLLERRSAVAWQGAMSGVVQLPAARRNTRAHQGESSTRDAQQRRAGMQVQGCDARPGACGRAHQGRRWCGRRRWNRRFVDRPLVAHPLAPPSVILPTAPDLRYLPRARVKRSAHARWSSTAPACRPLYCARSLGSPTR